MHRVEPKVFLIGETRLLSMGCFHEPQGLDGYLKHVGTKWRPDPMDQHGTYVSDAEKLIEVYGRLCYRSWEPGLNPNVTKVREGNDRYLGHVIEVKHGSLFEHPVTHWIFADVSRVFTHELVRHRAGMAFSQESLRYVRLTDLGLWLPPEMNDPKLVELFETTFKSLEEIQLKMAEHFELDKPNVDFGLKKKLTSSMRRLAPIGLATTIGVSMNFRALRHIGELRTDGAAEAEIRLVIDRVMAIASSRWPSVFQDFKRNEAGEWKPKASKI